MTTTKELMKGCRKEYAFKKDKEGRTLTCLCGIMGVYCSICKATIVERLERRKEELEFLEDLRRKDSDCRLEINARMNKLKAEIQELAK